MDQYEATIGGSVWPHIDMGDGLQKIEREKIRVRTREQVNKRWEELERIILAVQETIVTKRAKLFGDPENKLEEQLREEIKSGNSTDAYEVYKRLLRDNKMRKYPYYFEIEIHVVDSLNKILKEQFLNITKTQVGNVTYGLIADIRNFSEKLNGDVNYNSSVAAGFEEKLTGVDQSLQNMVDNTVSNEASRLDELLVHTPSRFFSLLGRSSNAIVDGLEKAARMHNQRIRDTKQEIRQEDMDARTRQIRSTLENHYIKRTGEFRVEVAKAVWMKARNEMIDLKKALRDVIDREYEPVLAEIKARQVSDESAGEKTLIESRAKMFRESIERIENILKEMRSSPIPVTV